MDINLSSSSANSSSNTQQGGVVFDHLNPFSDLDPGAGSSNRPTVWDFGTASFGGNML